MFLSNGSVITKTPVSLTTSSYFPYVAPMSSHNWGSVYSGIYEKQVWVYTLVNKLAAAEARLPLVVYKKTKDDGRERIGNHPMSKLLANPNPGLSGYALLEWTSSIENIYGEAFWLKRRDGNGVVIELYPLHPASMTWHGESNSWVFDNGNTVLGGIHPNDIVHFKLFHPTSTTDGLSPLAPLRATLENEYHARQATSSFWQRGARPGMALRHPGNLSDAAQSRLREQMQVMHSGSANTGTTMLLEEGMQAEKFTLTAEEAQYIETRKLNREEVCAAYDVPPPVVHILDHATFSNITEQLRSMYRDTLAPRLKRHEAVIEHDLRAVEWPREKIYAEFLMDEVLRGDFEARQDALAKASHMTLAEKRKIENLPFIEGTDRIFLNTATMPLDAIDQQSAAKIEATRNPPPAIAPPEPEPAEAEPEAEAEPPARPKPGARSVAGRLSWQSGLDDVDPLYLTKGLSDRDAVRVFTAYSEETALSAGTLAGLRQRITQLGEAGQL